MFFTWETTMDQRENEEKIIFCFFCLSLCKFNAAIRFESTIKSIELMSFIVILGRVLMIHYNSVNFIVYFNYKWKELGSSYKNLSKRRDRSDNVEDTNIKL